MTSTQSILEGESITPSITHDSSVDEDENFARMGKARHKRRLLDRWRCKVVDHSYCFKEGDLVHTKLTEEAIDKWAEVVVEGYATLLRPPESIVPNKHDSDTDSTHSTHSQNTITYQRPFRFQLNPSLSDLRSLHHSLSSSRSSSSSTSSVQPGIGYLSGKAIKWVGEKILDAVTVIEIRRRVWVIGKLIDKIEVESADDLQRRVLKNEKSFHRAVDDLLELSSNDYKPRYQKTSYAYGRRMRAGLRKLDTVDNSKVEDFYWTLSSKVFPTDTLHPTQGFVSSLSISLREILLQASEDTIDINEIIPELVLCACNDLRYGTSQTSRQEAYMFISRLYQLPLAKTELRKLGKPDGLLHDVARKVFTGDIESHAEKTSAVRFFAHYADDNPEFRHYVLGPSMSYLVSCLQRLAPDSRPTEHPQYDWDELYWFCRAICAVSNQGWAVSALVNLHVCNYLLPLLMSHHSGNPPSSWIDFWIIQTNRNIVVSGDAGRRAVHDALTPEQSDVLQELEEMTWPVDWMTKMSRQCIFDILSRVAECREDGAWCS